MKRMGWLCVVPAMLILAAAPVFPQVESTGGGLTLTEVVPYHVDIISFASLNSTHSRLDVFVQVSHDNLSFIKRDDQYVASYEVTIIVNDSLGGLVNERQWTEQVRVTNFDESVSPYVTSLTQRSLEISPGKYSVTTIVRDAETKIARRLVREVRVRDFSEGQIALSDIMLVRRLTVTGGKRSIVPSINPNVGNLSEGFHLFFEVYNRGEDVDVRFVIVGVNDQRIQRQLADTVQRVTSGRSQVFIHVDNSSLPLGNYAAVVQAVRADSGEAAQVPLLASSTRKFMIRWLGLPRGIADLDAAIDQIQYIAKDSELQHVKSAPTLEEKQKRFLEFWKTKDPNPNTPRNEMMEEYYAKVEYANKNFKHYIEGWRTDMGMVYIIFGAPNNVDRHPFDMDSKPYEIWSYYELNHRFVFVDRTGFGDYRLTTPIWEVWQRPRN